MRVPGDKSISHRALIIGALAAGTSTVRGLSTGDDVRRTRQAAEALGAEIEDVDGGIQISGGMLVEPPGPLDLGNSGTSMRLLAGVCAAEPIEVVLTGDESLRSRPMDRVGDPLRLMGATVEGSHPPVRIRGGGLHGIDYEPPMASAQVKGAVLFAGLQAEGETVVREPVPTRAHTEEMLAAAGADLVVDGGVVRVRPSKLEPADLEVPGDPSQAAFWIVAACIVPGSDLTLEGLYLGPQRDGFLEVLRRMGADLEVGESAVRARSGELAGTEVPADEIPGLIDEIPVLVVAAAMASGRTRFSGVGELRVKESDRVASILELLTMFGVEATAEGDTLAVEGTGRLRGGATVDSHGDHRIAMAAAVAGLAADGTTTIDGWDVVATSYPGFEEDLRSCTA